MTIRSQAAPDMRHVKSEKTAQKFRLNFNKLVARSEGFEPPTPRFEVWCSIQLSYER